MSIQVERLLNSLFLIISDKTTLLFTTIDRQVTIEERPEMTFYVRQYGGFALSHDDIEDQYDELKRDLRGEDFDSEVFYSVGYNSPFTVENRRNEIWIQM